MAILSASQGNPVWTASVRDNDFGYARKSSAAIFKPTGMQSNEQFLMQKQTMTGAGAPPLNSMSYNSPYTTSQPVSYGPSRTAGAYPNVAQV